jgi:hypothetical protein
MPRFRSRVYVAAAVALPLAACVSQPWTLSASADTITLRWYSDTTDEVQARGVATAFCAQTSRAVDLGAIEQSGSAVIANYRCR